MKKLRYKLQRFLQHRNRKKMQDMARCSRRIKHRKYSQKIYAISNKEEYIASTLRTEMLGNVYRKRLFDGKPIIIKIENEFGIEDRNGVDYYLDMASLIVDFRANLLTFDLSDCSRMWPSGVTLMCSLKHWVEMTARASHNPSLSSTKSVFDHVNAYLSKCGFYDYVGRHKDKSDVEFSETEMVKIEQETDRMRIKARRDQLKTLINQYSSVSDDNKERFIDVVLTEVILNVVEHGVGSNSTMGWWAIAQLHPQHGFISLCIADNGIGIRNSLLSGSQHAYIKEKYADVISDEGQAIKLAFDESISGALNAPVKEKKRFRKDQYRRGSHRGNGLKRIKEACKEIGISMAVLSHKGYLFVDAKGTYEKMGSRDRRVFAGTLYQFVIPAKGVQNDKES